MSDTATRPDNAAEVANTIRQQLGIFGLGVVGASHMAYDSSRGRGALTFKARLHFAGQSRARIMRVTIILTDADLYDVVVCRPDYTEATFADGIYAEDLTATMYRLDAEGI